MVVVIGLDFGSSGIKIAYLDRTGQPVVVRGPRGGNSLPSVVYIDEKGGRTLLGEDAFEQSFVDPANAICQFKLKLGTDETLLAGKTATELTAMLLVEAKKLVERQTGATIDGVVLTVPANFTDAQKKALLRAAELASLQVLRLISEPAAAGLGYAVRNASRKRGEKYLVFDFGSSTFDTCILEVEGDAVNLLASEGIQKLGGDDIDRKLSEIILSKLEQETGMPTAELLLDPLFLHDLKTRTTRAKISLGEQDRVHVPLQAHGKSFALCVERMEFEAAVRPLIDQALGCVDKALQAAGITAAEISSLYLVGGPCRSSFLQSCVADYTGLVPRAEIDPETAVAQGAALVAQSELRSDGRQGRIGTDVIPQPDAFLREATHHDIGVAVDDRSNGNKSIVNAVVVPKNTPVPGRLTKFFRLESPDQRDVIIEILQGPDRADIAACGIIGRLELRNLPVEMARSPRIEITFEFDKNTCVKVTARDLISGQVATTSVDVSK